MKQKGEITKRSAASRKAWRTRKRMAKARSVPDPDPLRSGGVDLDQITFETVKLFDRYHVTWPAYVRRALPCPAFGTDGQ
jgi:hypothetical protein